MADYCRLCNEEGYGDPAFCRHCANSKGHRGRYGDVPPVPAPGTRYDAIRNDGVTLVHGVVNEDGDGLIEDGGEEYGLESYDQWRLIG